MQDSGKVCGNKSRTKLGEVIDVMVQLRPPKTVKDIRSFLGHTGLYCRFIKDFSKVARPLTRLLCKEAEFIFDEECLTAFLQLKEALVTAPIVQAPDWSLPFEIMCDANDYAVDAVLGQRKDKKLNVIYYASRTLDDAHVNYTTSEKELLAVVFAVEKFRQCLVGSKLTVHTDHAVLKELMKKKDAKPSLLRWILLLQEFNMEIVDKPGTKNGVADHLSRMMIEDEVPINDSMPEEQLMSFTVAESSSENLIHYIRVGSRPCPRGKLAGVDRTPWYADLVNYLVAEKVPESMEPYQRKKFFQDVNHYFWDELYLYKRGVDELFRRCIADHLKTNNFLKTCDAGYFKDYDKHKRRVK